MNIFESLRGHFVVEDNNLNGMRQGHMVAQLEFDPTGHAKEGFLDNGYILKVSNDLKLVVADKLEGDLYLHYSDEHMSFLDNAPLDMFTVNYNKANVAYPRAIALKAGDVFTTNAVDGLDAAVSGTLYQLTVVNGLLTLGAAVTEAEAYAGPIGKLASLPTGAKAIEVFWRGGK